MALVACLILASSAAHGATTPKPTTHAQAQTAKAQRDIRLRRAREIREAMRVERKRHIARMRELEKLERAARHEKDSPATQRAREQMMSERMLHAQRMRDLRVKNEQNHTAVPKG